MMKFAGLAFAALVIAPQGAAAQEPSFYTCPNKPVRLNIPSMPLGQAVEIFTKATRCPVSIDVQQVANAEATDVPTFAIKGRYTPAQALRQMLSSSPLKARQIKGGYSVYMD